MQVKTARDCRVRRDGKQLTPDQIATIRKDRLGVSQALFAGLLDVSLQTVHAWEQGVRKPSGMALRLLALADDHPSAFTSRLQALREEAER